ncbi:hypothetical protein LINPERPRIM_LOCUS10007 [Linum perenne]
MLTKTVMTSIAKAIIFIMISLFCTVPSDGMEFAITTQSNIPLLSLESWSTRLGIGVLRSTENLTATVIIVSEVALMEKNLLGNQKFLCRQPWTRSAAMAIAQTREAAAT